MFSFCLDNGPKWALGMAWAMYGLKLVWLKSMIERAVAIMTERRPAFGGLAWMLLCKVGQMLQSEGEKYTHPLWPRTVEKYNLIL